MVSIKAAIYLVIGLAVAFLLLGITILPWLNTSYIGGCKRSWVCSTTAGNTCDTTTLNSTTVTGTGVCATNCMGCAAASTQESWSAANAGLVILIFFMAMIGFAVKFVGKI